ncbi:alpha/beta hydrolase [Patescibacteria group bacterium]|nr:alpha/beta hydrolase [Patescibacteria group bacterium]
MKQQVVIIHGGTPFDTYEDYLSYLKNQEISLDSLRLRKGWKEALSRELGQNFDVLMPQMPSRTNARYEEWKIWFEKIIPFFNKNIIFIGQSLGGIFLAKYLSENNISKKIKATILVSAPFDDENEKSGKSLADFKLSSSLERFAKNGGKIYLIQSKDDPEVLFEQLEKYKKALPSAKTMIFENRGHFNQESFPEIIELIKKL